MARGQFPLGRWVWRAEVDSFSVGRGSIPVECNARTFTFRFSRHHLFFFPPPSRCLLVSWLRSPLIGRLNTIRGSSGPPPPPIAMGGLSFLFRSPTCSRVGWRWGMESQVISLSFLLLCFLPPSPSLDSKPFSNTPLPPPFSLLSLHPSSTSGPPWCFFFLPA